VKVTQLEIGGEVSVSRDYQSAKASFRVVVELDEQEQKDAKNIYRRFYRSLHEVALGEARERLEAILTGGA
jgi:hypothetical protein